jgi:hypothetical protein
VPRGGDGGVCLYTPGLIACTGTRVGTDVADGRVGCAYADCGGVLCGRGTCALAYARARVRKARRRGGCRGAGACRRRPPDDDHRRALRTGAGSRRASCSPGQGASTGP